MQKVILTLLSITVLSLGISQGHVDGFLKGKGNLDAAFSGAIELNSKFIGNGTTFNIQRNIIAASAFVAYGIGDKLDVNLSIPFISVNGAEKGFQDGAIYLKYKLSSFKLFNKKKLVRGDFILAGGFSSNFTNYQTQGGSAIGQKAKALDFRPVFQFYFPNSIFATVQTGYTYKFDPVPNAFPFALKVGLAKSNYYLDVWYDFQHSFGGTDYPELIHLERWG